MSLPNFIEDCLVNSVKNQGKNQREGDIQMISKKSRHTYLLEEDCLFMNSSQKI